MMIGKVSRYPVSVVRGLNLDGLVTTAYTEVLALFRRHPLIDALVVGMFDSNMMSLNVLWNTAVMVILLRYHQFAAATGARPRFLPFEPVVEGFAPLPSASGPCARRHHAPPASSASTARVSCENRSTMNSAGFAVARPIRPTTWPDAITDGELSASPKSTKYAFLGSVDANAPFLSWMNRNALTVRVSVARSASMLFWCFANSRPTLSDCCSRSTRTT